MNGASDADWITAVASVLAAIGTVGAVAVALWQTVWRERRAAPRLRLARNRSTDMHYLDTAVFGYVTLTVSNTSKHRTAHDVEVLLSVWNDVDPNLLDEATQVKAQPLVWWMSDATVREARTLQNIPPGVERQIALLCIGDPQAVSEQLSSDCSWEELGESERSFRRGQPGVFALAPLDVRSTLFTGVDYNWRIALTITARDVEASTLYSRVKVSRHSEGNEEQPGLYSVMLGTLSVTP
jgi:hypothetical protein